MSEKEDIKLTGLTISVSQDGNCLGSTAEFEEMTISIESDDTSIDDNSFFTIKTDTGWSFNDREEWIKLYDTFINQYQS
jgi:hypothetical protein